MPKKKKHRVRSFLKNGNYKRVSKRLFAFAAIVSLTWGVWKILDHFFWPGSPVIGGVVVILGALGYLFLDDFHLKELE